MNGRRASFAALAVVAACASVAAGGCGAGSAIRSPSPTERARSLPLAAAGQLDPPRQAPEIALHNWNGRPVRLAQFRGRAVLLTFIYDHCPDTCPLIVDKLRRAQVLLGAKARSMQVVAVSVDPRGDTARSVESFLEKHRMVGRMDYLIGSQPELAPVWSKFDIGVQGDPESREVSHSALVYGITGSGRWTAFYDEGFEPSEIAHDVPILAAG